MGPRGRPGGYPFGPGGLGSGRRYDESCMMFKEPAGGIRRKSVEVFVFVLFLFFVLQFVNSSSVGKHKSCSTSGSG